MKYRTIAVAAALGMSNSAFAQSSVTLYGILDTGIELVTHANAAGDRVVRMPGITGSVPSRWGMHGTEDLGGGLAAIFTLENGFNTRSGDINQGGRLFGRQAWVGMSGPYGTLTFGRQYTMSYWAILDSDALGPDIYGGLGSLDAYIPNARSDNTIAYKGTFSGVTVGATYSFGRDSAGTGNSPGQGTCAGSIPGNSQACRQWSAMLRYDSNAFGVAGSYDEQRGGPGAAANFFNGVAPLPLTSSGDKDVRMQLNGYFKLGQLKVGGGWLGRHVETVLPTVPDVRTNTFYLTGTYLVTPSVLVDGGLYRTVDQDQDTRATLAALRGTYLLSKRTAVYLQSGYVFNSAKARYTVSQGGGGTTPAAGTGQLGVMAGIRHTF
ncbi:porin [Paraburkholderia panacisoli]|uniref:Porin n=1 Tax=Paraburkholderia panacisoli TaxID=2603818 RepID=A0A5B0G612_9BURK|nr:porin [Paraburkholderia panacisoli]KAA0998816.1 porin [Paraburkholderia panacisoli]